MKTKADKFIEALPKRASGLYTFSKSQLIEFLQAYARPTIEGKEDEEIEDLKLRIRRMSINQYRFIKKYNMESEWVKFYEESDSPPLSQPSGTGKEETKKCVGCGYDLPLSYFNPKEKCYLCDVSTALPLHEEDEQTEPYPTLSDGRTIDWQAYHEDKRAPLLSKKVDPDSSEKDFKENDFLPTKKEWKHPMTMREVMEAEETKEEGCAICGGQLVLIRGIFPGTDKRSVCPTCNTERLEQIYEISAKEYGKTYQSRPTATISPTTQNK